MVENKNNQAKILETLAKNRGRGIKYILDEAYEILGNPLIMNDTTYKLLAYSENKVTDDILWNELIELGTFSHKTVNFFSREQFIEDVANTDVLTVLKSKKLKYNRVNAKIFDKSENQIGNICVVACYKEIQPEEYEIIEGICEILSDEIENSGYYQNYDQILTENFIGNLIENKIVNKQYLSDKLENVYKNLKENVYIAVIDITKYENTLTHLNYFRDLLKQIQGEFDYFIYLNNIVAIISTDNSTLNIKNDLKKLNVFFRKNNISAGISSGFQNIFELPKYYKQALNALNYGMNVDIITRQSIFEYDNFRLDCFLSVLKNDMNIKDLCHPIIFLIQEYDREYKTKYYDILCSYLWLGRNVQLVAKILKIDYNDLNQKLQEISTKFNIDWDNGDMILSLFTSIKIAKYFL